MKTEHRINPSVVARIVAVVPDRAMRHQSGTPFNLPNSASSPTAQIAFLAGFLSWLTPLNAMNEDEQRQLGVNAHGKLSRHDDDDESDGDHDDSGSGPHGVEHALRR